MRQSLLILLLGLGSLLASCGGTPSQPGGQVEQPAEENPSAVEDGQQALPKTQPDLEASDNAITPQSAPAAGDPAQGGSPETPAQPSGAIPYEDEGAADPQTTGELPLITEPDPSREAPPE